MNIREILSDAGISAAHSFVTLVAGMITIPLITRLLGAGAFGTWRTLISLVGLAALVGGMHLHGSLIRYSQQKDDSQVFVDLLSITTILGVLLTIFTLIGASFLYRILSVHIFPFELIVPAAILIGARLPGSILHNYLRAHKRIKPFEYVAFTKTLIETGSLIVAFWFFESLAIGLWALVSVTILFDIILMSLFLPKHVTWPNPANFRTYFKYGVPMIPKEIGGKLLHDADKFLIIFFLGPVATGFYAVAYSTARVLQTISGIFNSTLYPRVSSAWDENNLNELESFYAIFLRWYILLSIPAVIGFILVGDSIIRLISTNGIAQETRLLLPLLVIGFVFQGLESPLSYILSAAERTRIIALITLITALINIVFNIILIPIIGILGAAVTTMVAYGMRAILLYYFANHHISISFPVEHLAKSGAAVIPMTAVLWLLPIHSPINELLVYPPVGAIVFMLVFIKIGGIPERELKKFWNAVPDVDP